MSKRKRVIEGLRDGNLYSCLYQKLKLYILYKKYNFDKWHATAPFPCRPYKRILVDEINKLDINSVAVEIGGGLGDIISRVKTNKKYLIDVNINLKDVINLLHKELIFVNGSFDAIAQIKEESIDILVLVNWIHGIEKNIIISEIENILKDKKIKYIVLDEINTDIIGRDDYKYKHRFQDDIKDFSTKKIVSDLENIRKFRILEHNNLNG